MYEMPLPFPTKRTKTNTEKTKLLRSFEWNFSSWKGRLEKGSIGNSVQEKIKGWGRS